MDRQTASRGRHACGLLLAAVVAGGCASSPPEAFRVCVASFSPGQAAVFTAQHVGLFRERDLDVEFVSFGGSAAGVRALAAREFDICSGVGGPTMAGAILAGVPIVTIAELIARIPIGLVVAQGIETPADLGGRRIGVRDLNSSLDVAAKAALEGSGLDLATDLRLEAVGQPMARLAALQAGVVDAILVSPPVSLMAARLGFRTLVDLGQVGPEYPYEPLVASRRWLEQEPERVQRFLEAVVLGAHRFKTDPATGRAVLAKYLQLEDAELVRQTYEYFAPLIRVRLDVPLGGVRLALDALAATHPAAHRADPQAFVEPAPLRTLEATGLFERLRVVENTQNPVDAVSRSPR